MKRARRLARAPLKIVGADTTTGRRIIRLAEKLDRLDPARVLHDFARRIEAGRGAQPLPPRFERPAGAAPADLAPADDRLLITEEPGEAEPASVPLRDPLLRPRFHSFEALTEERMSRETFWKFFERRRSLEARARAITTFDPLIPPWRQPR